MTMENQISSPTTPSSSPQTMHKTSLTISKSKPKIRIIHIFAPEIIKTDAANFRELVQRLTGKPNLEGSHLAVKTKARVTRKKETRVFPPSKKMEIGGGFRERVKEEGEEMWRGGGFLGGFGEFDGFMQELNHLPFLEGTTQMQDVYGECVVLGN